MDQAPDQTAIPVVLAPDVIALSLVTPACRTVLGHWRDGRLQPVVTRDLLRLYVRILKSLTLPDAQVHRWALWFTHKERSRYLVGTSDPTDDYFGVLYDAAREGQARAIIAVGAAPSPSCASQPDLPSPILWRRLDETNLENPLATLA